MMWIMGEMSENEESETEGLLSMRFLSLPQVDGWKRKCGLINAPCGYSPIWKGTKTINNYVVKESVARQFLVVGRENQKHQKCFIGF